jgi:hypothetical protein
MSKTELFKLNKNTFNFQYLNATRVENRLKGGDGESSHSYLYPGSGLTGTLYLLRRTLHPGIFVVLMLFGISCLIPEQ